MSRIVPHPCPSTLINNTKDFRVHHAIDTYVIIIATTHHSLNHCILRTTDFLVIGIVVVVVVAITTAIIVVMNELFSHWTGSVKF